MWFAFSMQLLLLLFRLYFLCNEQAVCFGFGVRRCSEEIFLGVALYGTFCEGRRVMLAFGEFCFGLEWFLFVDCEFVH